MVQERSGQEEGIGHSESPCDCDLGGRNRVSGAHHREFHADALLHDRRPTERVGREGVDAASGNVHLQRLVLHRLLRVQRVGTTAAGRLEALPSLEQYSGKVLSTVWDNHRA